MSNRIDTIFQATAKLRRCLVAYTMAGDLPKGASGQQHADRCCQWLDNGVDILEIGVPFSDPMADGVAIQRAHQRALESGAHVQSAFDLAKAIRQKNQSAGLVLMSYANPLLQLGSDIFLEKLHESQIDGVLLVDCPSPEDPQLYQRLIDNDIAPIVLAAPNSKSERLERILQQARGFIYGLALKGVTGSSLQSYDDLNHLCTRIKQVSDLPIAAGFGFRSPEQLAKLPADIDAVVVGSALAELTENSQTIDCPEALNLIQAFAQKL